jgi:tRNA(adenine34) deaminase
VNPVPRLIGGGLPRPTDDLRDEAWMRRALAVAAGTPVGDVPVGAVVYGPAADGYPELATATNRREADADPTAHAEVLALRAAAGRHGDAWRLGDCTLVVTLEPCAMCAGAAVGARIGRIVYGAGEPRTGACGSVFDIPRESPLHSCRVRSGVLERECAGLLGEFFRERRAEVSGRER